MLVGVTAKVPVTGVKGCRVVCAKYRHKAVLALLDLLVLAASGPVALYLRFDRWPEAHYLHTWGRYLLVAIPLYFVVYFFFGLYSRLWRYASVRDLYHIAAAVSVASGCLFAVMYVNPELGFPRSVLAITWFLNVAAVGGVRFLVRLRADLRKSGTTNGGKRTLILGAGDAGRLIVEEITKHPELDCRPIGFLDDDPQKEGLRVAGLPILLAGLDRLEEIVENQGVKQVIIAMPSAPSAKVKELTQRCLQLGIKPRIVPGLYRVLNGGLKVSSLREVQIEDLLSRPEIKPDLAGILGYVQDKVVLITGAGGSIGSELARQVAHFGAGRLVLLGHGENSIYQIHKELKRNYPHLPLLPIIADVQDSQRINAIFSKYQPQVVFHAAAHKHVPLMEHNPTEAIKNNIFGTKNLAEAAHKYQAERFVLISTDKAVNPTSVMGATKRFAEMVVQSISRTSSTRFVAVRFGNVLGSRGSVVPLFQEQIAQGGPVTVTHPDMTRYFMTIPEAVSLVIQAGAMGAGGEVFVLDMGDPVKIVDLARDLISLSGLKPDQDIKIDYVGIRPGEKLYEELLTAEEGTDATQHKRIFIARQAALDAPSLNYALQVLHDLTTNGCQAQQVLDLVSELIQTQRQVAAANVGGA